MGLADWLLLYQIRIQPYGNSARKSPVGAIFRSVNVIITGPGAVKG